MPRSATSLVTAALSATLGLAATVPVAASDPPPSFIDSLAVAGGYHRELSLLSHRYFDQPERAAYEFERLTAEALVDQQAIELHPCFAEWWAYELMGLELMALSHELRVDYLEPSPEADAVERLGSRMWTRAMALVPVAGEACGIVPQTTPRLEIIVEPGPVVVDEE